MLARASIAGGTRPQDGTLTFSGGVTSGTGHTGTVNPYTGALIASGVWDADAAAAQARRLAGGAPGSRARLPDEHH